MEAVISMGSDLKASSAHIATIGRNPQDWKVYIDSVKVKVRSWDEHRRSRMISYLYASAFKVIPSTDTTFSHAQLVTDYALFTSHHDLNEAVRILAYGRRNLPRYSIIHVASAELELRRGERDEAVSILQKAISLETEPVSTVTRALERLNEGKTNLSDSINTEYTHDDSHSGILKDISNRQCESEVSSVQSNRQCESEVSSVQSNRQCESEVSSVKSSKPDILTSTSAASEQNPICSFPLEVPNKSESSIIVSCEPPKVVDKVITGDRCQRSDISADVKALPAPTRGPSRKLQLLEMTSRLTCELSGPITQLSTGTWPVYCSTPLSLRSGDHLEVRAESTRDMLVKQQGGTTENRTFFIQDCVASAITPAKTQIVSSNSLMADITPGASVELDPRGGSQNGGRDSSGEFNSSQLSATLRKFRPLNLGPPQRVKVNPAVKKWKDEEDEEMENADMAVSHLQPTPQPGTTHPQLANLGSSIPTIITEQIQEAPQAGNPPDSNASTASLFTAIKLHMMTPLSTTASASRLHTTSGVPLVAENKSDSSSLLPRPCLEVARLTGQMIIGDSSQRRDISAVLKVQPASRQGPSRKLQLPTSDATNRLITSDATNRLTTSDATNRLPSSDAINRLPSSDAINRLPSSDATNRLTTSDATNRLPSSDAINRLPSSDAINRLPSSDAINRLPSSDATNRLTAEITGPVAQLSDDAHPVDSSTPLSFRPDEQQQARVESTKEILVKQQEIIQQLLQQQQQQQQLQRQQQQSGFNNRTFSVRDSQSSLASGITPAKSHTQSEHKTIVVNGKPYTVMNLVGRGGSAKVYRVYDLESNTILAVKCVNLACANQAIVQGYKNEIILLKKLQNCGPVIKLYDYEYVEASKKLFVVLEYGETDLCKFISQNEKNEKCLHPINVRYFWLQMVSAVHAMHEEGVIHSDLKPANFILVSGEVKLIDFGIANSLQQDSTSVLKENMVGTPSYMSPEALMSVSPYTDDSKPTYKIGVRSDVWSLGCILYQMVYGHTPFQYVRQKLEAIVNPAHEIPFPDKGDPELMDILKKCLTRNILERPTTSELLSHPYLQK